MWKKLRPQVKIYLVVFKRQVREAWCAAVYGVTKSWMRLNWLTDWLIGEASTNLNLTNQTHLPMQETKRCGFDPWVRKMAWRRPWQPPPVFLPGESCGQRSLAGYHPWGRKESDVTEATYLACKRGKHTAEIFKSSFISSEILSLISILMWSL